MELFNIIMFHFLKNTGKFNICTVNIMVVMGGNINIDLGLQIIQPSGTGLEQIFAPWLWSFTTEYVDTSNK